MDTFREELESVYKMFTDETGKIPIANVDSAVRSAGYPIQKSMQSFSHATYVNFAEFVELVNIAQEHVVSRQEIERAFREFDTEGTGYISAQEFKKMLLTGKDALAESEISVIFEMFPPNEDGMICYSLPINYLFSEV